MAKASSRGSPRVPTSLALAQELLLACSRDGSLQLVQVGAHSGDFNQTQHADPVRPALRHLLTNPLTRALLIEPNPPVYNELVRNVDAHFKDPDRAVSRIQTRNVAVCPSFSRLCSAPSRRNELSASAAASRNRAREESIGRCTDRGRWLTTNTQG